MQVATFDGYPTASSLTHVTIGASRHPVSLYRRRPVGFELIATTPEGAPDSTASLANAVLDNLRLVRTRERRPFIEYNGVYAPGYPPHLLFTTEVTATPAFSGRLLVGDRYVYLLSALPITDAELRLYSRDVGALISALRDGNRATVGLRDV